MEDLAPAGLSWRCPGERPRADSLLLKSVDEFLEVPNRAAHRSSIVTTRMSPAREPETRVRLIYGCRHSTVAISLVLILGVISSLIVNPQFHIVVFTSIRPSLVKYRSRVFRL